MAPAPVHIDAPGNIDDLSSAVPLEDGQATHDRRYVISSSITSASQTLRLTFFTAIRSETITKIASYTGGTQAAATPTLCQYAIFEVEDNGDLTRLNVTANDTTLWASTSTRYEKALPAGVDLVKGRRYAVGSLCVSGAATPTFAGNGAATTGLIEPKIAAQRASQASMPSSITKANLESSPTGNQIYFELIR